MARRNAARSSPSPRQPRASSQQQQQQHNANANAAIASGGRSPNTPGSGSMDAESVTTEALMNKVARADEIESSLEAMAAEAKVAAKRKGGGGGSVGGARGSKSSDERQQAMRLQLCEVLSEVILNDSSLAESVDAIGRLWKTCFYVRINDIRSRISREKARAKKRQASGGAAEEASKKLAGDMERQLKQFLDEAIALYRYIIERYVRELTPLSQSQFSAGSQPSRQREEEEEERRRCRVIIAALYRMHIHLGDLHRYSNEPELADGCYLKSARMAPGTGNPYNQLAVVAQQSKDSLTVVALYHYARSLMATRSPFETSRSNLSRLFEGNRRWLDEHARGDNERSPSRGILNVGGGGKADRARREMAQREKASLNRKALARFVDLQWDFFRGVSLDGGDDDDGKIDLDGLKKKMSSLVETFAALISSASLSEHLLLKLVGTLAFSALGAGNEGRFLNADGFYAKRRKDPDWNREGIIMTNQALALSFLLRFCAALADDVGAHVSRKGGKKLGRINSMSPALLGLRFVMSVYNGCEWFHGLAFYPTGDDEDGGNDDLKGSSIHRLCKESHAEFWRSVADVANRLDGLPMRKNRRKSAKGEEEQDIRDVKELAGFRGYIPFSSFMDAEEDEGPSDPMPKDKRTKYASAEDVAAVLSETKQPGGVSCGRGAAAEADASLKIDLIVFIADERTHPSAGKGDAGDGQFFLARNPDTNEREFIDVGKEEDEVLNGEDEARERTTSSPVLSSHDVNDGMDTEDDVVAAPTTGETDDNSDIVPLQMSYSEKGMALLTPAALLAGRGSIDKPQPMNVADDDGEVKAKSLLPDLPIDSTLAPSTEVPPHLVNTEAAAAASPDTLLQSTRPFYHPQEMAKTVPVPPPPGFSLQPAVRQREQPPTGYRAPSATTTGISLADFTGVSTARPVGPHVAFGSSNQASALAGVMMPQAGPGYPTTSSNMFETLNPFFAQAPLPTSSLNDNFFATNPPSLGLNQPPGFAVNTASRVGVSLPHQQQQVPNKGGLDATLDSLLNREGIRSPDDLASSNAFDLLVPATVAGPDEDQSESILNFLFEPNDAAASRAGRPLYGNEGHPPRTQHGAPSTKNPFAT